MASPFTNGGPAIREPVDIKQGYPMFEGKHNNFIQNMKLQL